MIKWCAIATLSGRACRHDGSSRLSGRVLAFVAPNGSTANDLLDARPCSFTGLALAIRLVDPNYSLCVLFQGTGHCGWITKRVPDHPRSVRRLRYPSKATIWR